MVETTDLRKVLKGHTIKWVALSANRSQVVGVADNPKEALKQARINKEQNPILTKVPKISGALIL